MQFRDYWPEYLREHSRPATRAMHYAQTVFGGLAILWCIWRQSWLVLLGVLVFIFLWALAAHKFVEGNRPAAATHPFWWSVVNDLRMLFHFLTRTLKDELEKAGVEGPNKKEIN